MLLTINLKARLAKTIWPNQALDAVTLSYTKPKTVNSIRRFLKYRQICKSKSSCSFGFEWPLHPPIFATKTKKNVKR
ncbi:hypothetical protein ERO13_D04G017950v2 [Gossypium hirsutum]|uniref:Uncharacterized protein n=1 Tax=Gossypium raimondii TaxID=29730 RepID=A0A0D2V0M3_GOSRA|nr:hypothetical protein ERO13_D04G017950v2 [Gossypium hirsutum]KJB75046.1 hypothetical protein B456_012G020800 [Gossypium raimondii]